MSNIFFFQFVKPATFLFLFTPYFLILIYYFRIPSINTININRGNNINLFRDF